MEENINLFTPFKIKNINFKNRIVFPPMVRFHTISNDGKVNEKLIKHYEKLAKDGNGFIIVEATCVSKDGKLRENQLGIWDDSFIAGLSKIAEVCHKENVPVFLQLHHAGFYEKISEVKEEILDNILNDFVKAVERAKLCGYDGVEIHAVHKYLICQLNSPLWNKRTDKFGGKTHFERLYFSRELIKRTKHLFDDNFLLSFRIAGNEPYLSDGIILSQILEKEGVDLLHVSFGIPDPEIKQAIKVLETPPDFPLDWIIFAAKEIRKNINIPVISVSKIKTEQQASYVVENKLTEFVAVGRVQLFIQYSWVEKARKEYLSRINNNTN